MGDNKTKIKTHSTKDKASTNLLNKEGYPSFFSWQETPTPFFSPINGFSIPSIGKFPMYNMQQLNDNAKSETESSNQNDNSQAEVETIDNKSSINANVSKDNTQAHSLDSVQPNEISLQNNTQTLISSFDVGGESSIYNTDDATSEFLDWTLAQEEDNATLQEQEVKEDDAIKTENIESSDKEDTPTQESDGAALLMEDAKKYPQLKQWKQRVNGKISRVSKPAQPTATSAAGSINEKGSTLRKSREEAQPNYSESLEGHLPNIPKLEKQPEVPLTGIEKDAQVFLNPHKNILLKEQTMPSLKPTPNGVMPRLGDNMRRVQLERKIKELEKQVAEEGSLISQDPISLPKTETQLRLEQLKQELDRSKLPAEASGPAEAIAIKDQGEPPRTEVLEGLQADTTAVLARLLANVDGEAETMLRTVRERAFPDNKLQDKYPELGIESLPKLTDTLRTELNAVAEDAGISAEDLKVKVAEQKALIQKEGQEAELQMSQNVTAETAALDAMCTEEQETITGLKEEADKQAELQAETTNGESDPKVIKMKASRIRKKINKQLGEQRVYYDRAKTRRFQQLDQVKPKYIQAYKAATARESEKVAAENPDNPLAAAEIRLWGNARGREIDQVFIGFKTETTTEVTTLKGNVNTAGENVREAIQNWETEKIGEEKSWWEKLIETISNWLETSKAESESWSQINVQESRDALVGNVALLQQVRTKYGEQINLEAIESDKSLSREQKAVLQAYYGGGAEAGDSIAAVAVGTRMRLTQQHYSDIIEEFYTLLEQKPITKPEARKLELFAASINGGFNAKHITNECYNAIDGIGTDEDKVYRALSGLSRIESIAVKKYYHAFRGESLEDAIKGDFEDSEKDRAIALMDGNALEAAAAALNDAMDGLGTDEALIMQTLRGKTAEERQRLIEIYKQKYNIDLNAALKGELGGHDFDRADALMEGNTAKADAIALDQTMDGAGTDEKGIEQTYNQIRQDVTKEIDRKTAQIQAEARKDKWTPQRLREELELRGCTSAQLEVEITRRNQDVELSYNQKYGDNYNLSKGESALRTAFKDDLSGPELDLANAFADNDQTSVDAARLSVEFDSIIYADDDKANDILENQYQRALRERRRNEWPMIQMELNKRAAAEGWDAYERAEERRKMEAKLEQDARGQAEKYMTALETNYDNRYKGLNYTANNGYRQSGGLRADLKQFTQGNSEDKAMTLLDQGGYLTPVQQVEYATKGAGTDEEGLKNVFKGKTKEEIDEIKAEWNKKHPNESLEDRVKSELGGRDEFDTTMDMEGLPKDRTKDLKNMQKRAKWEKENTLFHGTEMRVLEREIAFMERQDAIINDTTGDVSDEDKALALEYFQQGRKSVDASIESSREQADSIANGAAMAAAITAGIVVSVLTAGAAAPGVAAALTSMTGVSVSAAAAGTAVSAGVAALAATAAQVTTKQIFLGEAYSGEDMLLDMGVGTVDVIAAMATAGVGPAALKSLGLGVDDLLKSKSAATRAFANFAAEGTEDIISSVPSAITGNVFNDQIWQSDNPLLAIVKATTTEVAMSGVVSGGMGTMGALGDSNIGKNISQDAPVSSIEVARTQIIDTQGSPYRAPTDSNPSGLVDINEGPLRPSIERNPSGLTNTRGEPLLTSIEDNPSGLINTKGEPLRPSVEQNPSGLIDADRNPLKPSIERNPSGLIDPRGKPLSAGKLQLADSKLQAEVAGGTSVYIDPNLNGNTVRVHYDLDANGLISNVYLRVGANASAIDIQLHNATVKAMQKYSGLSGRVRQLLAKVQRFIGLEGPPPNGSKAWEAHLEVQKLPNIIQARARALQNTDLDINTRAAIEADIRSLEAQLDYHQQVLDEMITTRGRGYVAADSEIDFKRSEWDSASPAEKQRLAVEEYGMPKMEDLEEFKVKSGYNPDDYKYVRDAGKKPPFELQRIDGNSETPVLKIVKDKDGKWTVVESKRQTGAAGEKQIVESWEQEVKTAFDEFKAKAKDKELVVPVKKIAATDVSFEKLISNRGDFYNKLSAILSQADLTPTQIKSMIKRLKEHKLLVIKGTEQLRRHDYRGNYSGGNIEGMDLHHIIPLWLGGGHESINLTALDPILHDDIHELFNKIEFDSKTTLNPASMQRKETLSFSEGLAKIDQSTGKISLYQYSGGEFKPLN